MHQGNLFKKFWPKNLNTLRFYSNSYLHCTRPYGEINFKNVSVITEKMDNKLHNLTHSLQPAVIYNVILKSYFLHNLSIHIFSIITTEQKKVRVCLLTKSIYTIILTIFYSLLAVPIHCFYESFYFTTSIASGLMLITGTAI